MIKKLKLKFIVLSMTALFVLLLLIVVGMNIINYNSVVKEADGILHIISQNKGEFPDYGNNKEERMRPDMSPELPYESRYFSVLLNESGGVIYTDTGHVAAVDSEAAIEYAGLAIDKNNDKGFVGDFRFLCQREDNAIRITFLDCQRKMDSFGKFLMASAGMASAGFVIAFFVIFFFAGRIIHPVAESYEKQKRFITDAGHELKTPITIINADVDVMEMEVGKNEFLEDIQLQTKRLTSLTNNLVLLARMEEAGNSMQMIDFPVSEIVADTAMPFKTLAHTQEKEFICNIQPMLSMCGNDKAIRQLVSILMDNALKYSPHGGKISLDFVRHNRMLSLIVFNTTETEISQDNLSYVFDRFYRTDQSRNSETGGHGIGLSVAKAIVTAHGGKIQAWTKDGHSFGITVLMPC